MRLMKALIIAAIILVCAACSPKPYVKVEERSVLTARQESEKLGGQLIRIVQPGDTLHAIAFATGLDVNQVAAWNGILDTSKLRAGQRIRLTKPIGFKSVNKTTVKSKTARPKTQVAKANKRKAVATKPKAMPKPGSSSLARPNITWLWPTKGSVVGRFSLANGRQGIDIKAPRGQTVTSSNTGEVVYVGNSLKGYGNLIIVKHSEQFLSAYAHNQSIFVREGETVKAGQKIAAIGLNKWRQNILHFQIRKNGKPIDPLVYLPKR